ncbi:hypothetical protein [Bacillus cereus group sp. N6]|uniref:hypothetical protein n=1 Tax=Bacillus cereus group sp. N6 TaxID=2794583 RepID=UPI001F5BAC55|nr:hypothetical protein [Bacillus cereus group sp. N6]
MGAIPAQVDPTKSPIVFVQGKNGKANDWYGETYYHGKNKAGHPYTRTIIYSIYIEK